MFFSPRTLRETFTLFLNRSGKSIVLSPRSPRGSHIVKSWSSSPPSLQIKSLIAPKLTLGSSEGREIPVSRRPFSINYSPSPNYHRLGRMNSKHLTTGSTCPPLVEGQLRIYSMRWCPYAQRALLVALAKGISIDVVNLNLKVKPDWLFTKNPLGKVPAIEIERGILYESLIVADYLDEVYPGRKLNSDDPFQRALDRMWVDQFAKVTSLWAKIIFSRGDPDALKNHVQELNDNLAAFENEIQRRKTKFFGGDDNPGMMDFMIWPWVERIPALKVIIPGLMDFQDTKAKNHTLEEWRQRMKSDSTVQKLIISKEDHVKFIESYLDGNPNYDGILCGE